MRMRAFSLDERGPSRCESSTGRASRPHEGRRSRNQTERKAGRNILERQGGEPETALRTGILPRSVSLVYPRPIVLCISDGIDGECGEGG